MIKAIDVVSTIQTPLTLQERKSGGSIMPYESLDTSPDIHNRVSSKPDWQKQLLLKTVSSIQAIGVCSALCSTHETC